MSSKSERDDDKPFFNSPRFASGQLSALESAALEEAKHSLQNQEETKQEPTQS